jgi:Methyl-accepting chemotaxis protein (MCP) signalling domain
MQKIGIVGGGKAGLRLLQILSGSSVVSVAFVVDVRTDAPALIAARQAGVPTYTDLSAAITAHPPQLVFEVTGSHQVAEHVRELCAGKSELVVAEAAQAILDAIEESHKALATQVVHDVGSMKAAIESSLGETRSLLESIDRITGDMQMLALNARIEAARVGDQGRGFAVVAQEMAGSTESIRVAARQLDQLNASIKAIADGLDAALTRLA